VTRRRVAVLISGRGSNLVALIEAAQEPGYPAEIALVVSNRPDASGLAHAADQSIGTEVVDHRVFATKAEFEARLDGVLAGAGIDLVCLAGFMRLLSGDFVEKWRDRMINIHPSLLPSFRGLHTHQRALAAGAKIHGATVHFVRAETDDGPILAQGAVPVLPDDDAATLAARVLKVEHRLYPLALKLVAGGAARVAGERVLFDEASADPDAALLSPAGLIRRETPG
jgi:phosphoribosylglycinamide formyltransferase-1